MEWGKAQELVDMIFQISILQGGEEIWYFTILLKGKKRFLSSCFRHALLFSCFVPFGATLSYNSIHPGWLFHFMCRFCVVVRYKEI